MYVLSENLPGFDKFGANIHTFLRPVVQRFSTAGPRTPSGH